MKTKFFFLVFLFIGIGLTRLSAQNNDTKSVQYKAELGYYTPVYCGGEMVNYLQGLVIFHIIDHASNGNLQWEIAQAKGEATGLNGEIFELIEIDKFEPSTGIFVWHFNLRGDSGSHYIGSLSYNYSTGEFIVGKAICL